MRLPIVHFRSKQLMFLRRLPVVLACAFSTVGTMSVTFTAVAPPCDMEVKDGPTALQWRCRNGDCTNCDVDGDCDLFEEGEYPLYVQSCDCDAGGGVVQPDDCTTNININVLTGVISLVCWTACCGSICPAIPDPPPPFPVWVDPCPCPPGD